MLPIKQLLSTFAPAMPMAITSLAFVTLLPAPEPNAILPRPKLLASALAPTAVLNAPVVLLESALTPTAVLAEPGPPFGVSTVAPVLLKRAAAPTAVLPKPRRC